MSFCMLCMVAFCQSVLLKRDDDDDGWNEMQFGRHRLHYYYSKRRFESHNLHSEFALQVMPN